MTPIERRATLIVSALFCFRMLGLFMLLPVLTVYGSELANYTPMLAGIAIGAYGFTQACLQIPAGALSDRIGRKPVILGGLALFAIGSLVAALSSSIYGVIIGRALQGSGAIASAAMALASDVTRPEQRTKIMAAIGMTMGLSFALAMVIGPKVAAFSGLQGVFILSALLAVLGMLMVRMLPTAALQKTYAAGKLSQQVLTVLRQKNLLGLDAGILILHFLMTAIFIAIPKTLQNLGYAKEQHSWIYLGALLVAFVVMLPMLIIAERKRQHRALMLLAIALLGMSILLLLEMEYGGYVWLALGLFFTAFNLLEAMMPSLLSRIAPSESKGAAMGVYASSQFMGAFLGGAIGGGLYQMGGQSLVFAFCGGLCIIWLGVEYRIGKYRHVFGADKR